MRLFIAEKPSLARAIADVLPAPKQKAEGFIRAANGDVVSWCIGHLLEQAEPEAYNSAYKTWRTEHLPILPETWQLKAKAKTRKQLTVLKKLIKDADCIVHAGDPDREGQLLVDQVIDFLGVKGDKKNKVERCLISDLNPSAVTRAINNLRPNHDFVALSTSALARSRADWLYGINMTRAMTLQGRKVGFHNLLSVGRVQTPVLGLVVRRDIEIENFTPKPYYEVLAHLETASGASLSAKWCPSDACSNFQDEEGRIVSKALAENVVTRIRGQQALLDTLERKAKSQAAPLPYNLSALQIDAAKRYGYSAKQVLDICQTLYERHKIITYPRSDSRFLPQEHYLESSKLITAIAKHSAELQSIAQAVDKTLKSRTWNDAKVDAHHAIIPTKKSIQESKLSPQENHIYFLIARQYLCQFYPKWQYKDTRIDFKIAGGVFVAKARETQVLGWKSLFISNNKVSTEKQEEYPLQNLPSLSRGDTLHCLRGELCEKTTLAPKAFNDASLLSAMTGIARFVTDTNLKKVLKDTDGLGTEATRAGIIELLFSRNFLQRQGKKIQSTAAAKALISSLPECATTPDMTAQWESHLNAISQREAQYHSFMDPLVATLKALIAESLEHLPLALKGLPSSPPKFKRRAKSVSSGDKKTSTSRVKKHA
ncbi:MAG: DNA topoisomerase-3 [Flavobacteriales bacterium]|jgi:DNA topoisomerase-3